jgi:uncharacterized membrane protein YidH (DUF202 family)
MTSNADNGLQPERTQLAWTRTSLAVLANGVLVLLKDPMLTDDAHRARLAVAVLSGVVALGIFLTGVHRQRELAARPLPRRLTARAELVGVGVAMLILSGVVVAYLLLPPS